MLTHACADDDLLHWAVGLDLIPSVTEIRKLVPNVIAKARRAIPASLQNTNLDVNLGDVSKGYKVSSGKVSILVEFEDKDQYPKLGLLSKFFTEILTDLSSAGLDTSIVLLHEERATVAISSSANPNVAFVQTDDFDPNRPNVASSLRGARATSFDHLEQTLDAIIENADTRGGDPVKLSLDKDSINPGAHHSSCGEGVLVRSPSKGEKKMTQHTCRTREVDERIRYLTSKEFATKLTQAIQRAVDTAIARHHEAGFPAHGEQDGKIIEY